MVATGHVRCTLCDQANKHNNDAGPSISSSSPPCKLKRRTMPIRTIARQLCVGLAAAALAISPPAAASPPRQRDVETRLSSRMVTGAAMTDPSLTLGSLMRKRERSKRQYSANQNLNFEVNVTPPKTCEPMNITFSTQGGQAPYTVFVGFSDWYGYSVQLPASYADADVSTWLYQFDVPVFRPVIDSSSPTPVSVVVVSDSTGNLMNSSTFQQVVEEDKSCAGVSGALDFTFYNDPTITACNPLKINWQYAPPQPGWKDPVDIFIIPERAPPIHIPVTNSSAGEYDYNVTLQPGTNVLLTMTDKGGSGGVSGRNTVGGSEYVGLNCLTTGTSTTLPIAVPSPTTVLSNLRMPDYTAMVSSIVTDNGVVKTNVAQETVRHGSTFGGSGGSTGRIVGLATGIGVGAAILAALVSWCVWRRRHGRRNVFWEVPRSLTGELSKERGTDPIDEGYLRNRSKAMSRTGSANVPMLGGDTTTSPRSDASEERYRRQMNSEGNLSDSRYDSFHQMPPNNRQYSSISSGSLDVNSYLSPPRRNSASSSTSNPFANAHAVAPPSRGYRSSFNDRGSEHEMESMGMTSAASYYDSAEQYGSQSSRGPSNPTYVQHSDAGLLLDDTVEVPPLYSDVPADRREAAARRARQARGAATATAAAGTAAAAATTPADDSQELGQSSDIALTGPDDLEDDSKFWVRPFV